MASRDTCANRPRKAAREDEAISARAGTSEGARNRMEGSDPADRPLSDVERATQADLPQRSLHSLIATLGRSWSRDTALMSAVKARITKKSPGPRNGCSC